MGKLSVARLAQDLVDAMGVLRNKSDLQESVGLTSAMLLIKRASDQPGFLNVPDQAQWSSVMSVWPHVRAFEHALGALEHANLGLLEGVSHWLSMPKGLTDADIRNLVDRLNGISLRDSDLESNNVVGRAFNRYIDSIADSAGKRSYEFSTPAPLRELMVRLARPSAGQSVYDPFAGVGGFLVDTLEYVRENTGDDSHLSLRGQEINSATCAIAKINLALNNSEDGDLLQGDSLGLPNYMTEDGRVEPFDRVLTHAPFSMKYEQQDIGRPAYLRYGLISGHGKADLMIVQQVLAALAPDGIGAVLVPSGVLFRGGGEAHIRRGIIEDGRIEAVIALGAGVVPGLSIPACILVVRGWEWGQREPGKEICFINAEDEVASGRSGSRLSPEVTERIIGALFDRAEIPGFSHVASIGEISDNGFDLSVRRYVQGKSSPAPRLDSRAIIYGGIPREEIKLASDRFRNFGINLENLFQAQNRNYLDFAKDDYRTAEERIAMLAASREGECADALRSWWFSESWASDDLAGGSRLFHARAELLASFQETLLPVGVLEKYRLSAIFAGWWSAWHDDLRALASGGFLAVIERWTSGTEAYRTKEAAAREQVLARLGDDLLARTQAALAVERQGLTDIYKSWIERYSVSLARLEEEATSADTRLRHRLRELGYAADW